jgi:hypothetical protein
MSSPLRALALLGLLGQAACLPFATPPVQGGVGMGLRRVQEDGLATHVEPTLHLQAAVDPFQFSPELLHRPFDVGLGGLYDLSAHTGTLGALLEGGVVAHEWPVGESSVGRVLPRLQARVLWDESRRRAGVGLALQTAVEVAQFLPGDSFSSGGGSGALLGYAYGETGIGLFGEASYGRLGTQSLWQLSLGLNVRLPASVGLLCCFSPH